MVQVLVCVTTEAKQSALKWTYSNIPFHNIVRLTKFLSLCASFDPSHGTEYTVIPTVLMNRQVQRDQGVHRGYLYDIK